jgi:DNA-binding MarR family transcriptional regulator
VSSLTPKGRIYRGILDELFRLRASMIESAEDVAKHAGLTTARWQILGAVEDQPATVAHVARRLGLTRQAVQETADAMAREDLVTFGDNPDHKRARLMAPTDKARSALAYLRPRQIQFANLMGAPHSLEQLQTTLTVLQQSRAAIEAGRKGAAE